MNRVVVCVALAVCCTGSAAWCQEPAVKHLGGPPPQVLALLNQGKIEEAEKLLRQILKERSGDVPSRLLLGRVIDFDGRPDEAVKVWQEGLRGELEDFPLLMSIGELRARQGRDGPGITNRRGTVIAKPYADKQAAEKFKRDHLRLAADAFKKALELAPDQRGAARELAKVYSERKDHVEAVKAWRKLHELDGDDAEAALGLAQSLADSGKSDEAATVYQNAIAINPRLATAHAALAEHYKAMGNATEAEKSHQQAEFYEKLPSFTRLTYSAENAATLAQLNHAAAVQSLIDDPSERSTDFLAVLCWSHPHNELETRAFESLEERGKDAIPVVRKLLEHAQSTCTIRSSANILARHKDPGLLERLLPMLPGDMRAGGFEMDIAGALAELGDPRAVRPLAEQLNPTNRAVAERNSPQAFLLDRTGARARAALALGAFDTPAARQALTQGLDHPQLGSYCSAALYRLTRDAKYVDQLRKVLSGDDGYMAYQVARYLRKIDAPEAKQLVENWDKRVKEKAEKAAKEQNP